jgi:hypothetical protein
MMDRFFKYIKGIFSMVPLNPHSHEEVSPPRRDEPILPTARRRIIRLPENTVQGCRDRATADLLEAVTVITATQRRHLASSAESWAVRANLLGRLGRSFEKREALDRAHKQYGIDNVRL